MERSTQQGKLDYHTTRTLGKPALGGLICVVRMVKCQMHYKESKEAVFWSDIVCKPLRAGEPHHAEFTRRGRELALKNGRYNEAVMAKILDEAQRVFQESR